MTTETREESRQRMHKEMTAFHAEHEKNWTAEREAEWVKRNADYDANYKALEGEWKEAEERQARANRIAQLVGHNDRSRKAVSNPLIGRDNLGGDGASTAGGMNLVERQIKTLTGMLRAITPEARAKITKDEIEAGKSLGLDIFQDRQVNLDLLSTHRFSGLQRAGGYYDGRYQNVLTTGTGSSGGFTIGDTFVAQLERAQLYYGPMLQAASVIRTSSGEPMNWPTATDTSNTGAILPESTATVLTPDPTFGQITLNAHTFTSKGILIPNQLLQDSMFDLIPILADMLGERIGRIKNTKYTLGVGGIEPKGIVPASTVGPTTASATAIIFDELLDLEHSVDISRRTPDCGYMFHDNILLALRKLKDTNAAYIWQPGAPTVYQTGTNMGAPDRLNTYRYWINNDMQSTIAASTKTILFGQLTAFKIREVGSAVVVVGRELYALSNQTFIVVFERGDSNLLDAGDHPVKHLLQKA